MEIVLVVGLGGAIGAILRWWIGVFVSHLLAPAFLGTLTVNLIGSFMIGLLLILNSIWNTRRSCGSVNLFKTINKCHWLILLYENLIVITI